MPHRHNVRGVDPVASARRLRAQGIDVYVLGIGTNIDVGALREYTDDVSRVFIADFSTVDAVAADVARMIL